MILVLTSGSAVALDEDEQGAQAILEAWYPGEEGGNALADILTGRTNPSGRLPVTFYRAVADLPAFSDYSMARRTYRYFDGAVLYPFGFGLSYTSFHYGTVHLSRQTLAAGESLTTTVRVRNSGSVSGSAVAELYLVPPPLIAAPRLTLQGMQRVTLNPGESRLLTFALTPQQFSLVDPSGKRSIRPGQYRIIVAGTQPDSTTTGGATLTITAPSSLQ